MCREEYSKRQQRITGNMGCLCFKTMRLLYSETVKQKTLSPNSEIHPVVWYMKGNEMHVFVWRNLSEAARKGDWQCVNLHPGVNVVRPMPGWNQSANSQAVIEKTRGIHFPFVQKYWLHWWLNFLLCCHLLSWFAGNQLAFPLGSNSKH